MKKGKNQIEKYFDDPVQNAAFICCTDILAELIEKYCDRVLHDILQDRGMGRCDYAFLFEGVPTVCEMENIVYDDIIKSYIQIIFMEERKNE